MSARKTNNAPDYTPGPDEIAYRCRNIQRQWSASEERSRRTGTAVEQPYKVPAITEGALPLDRMEVRVI